MKKSMKNTLLVAVLAAAATLAACGGGDDGSSKVTPTATPSPTPASTTAPATPACAVSGTTVTVPKDGSCTHSDPKVNGGAAQTYSCSNGRVSSNGISGVTVALGDYTYKCAS